MGTSTSGRLLDTGVKARELRGLLQRRLKQIMSIGSLALFGMAILHVSKGELVQCRGIFALSLVMASPAVYLHRRPEVSFEGLRKVELLCLVLSFIAAFYNCIFRLTNISLLPEAIVSVPQGVGAVRALHYFILPNGAFYAPDPTTIPCNPIILTWTMIAVLYAVLIPNTGRRCVTVMGFVLLAALLCTLYAGWHLPPFRAYLGPALFYTGLCVSIFSATGLYGSHKLEVLRTQALVAQQVGQYRLQRRLGKGGMGEVYLAQHRLLRRPCAVKLIRLDQTGDASALARFEREVQAMAQLTHPNTVEIYDYGHTEEGMFYYAMEYLPGLSADELLRAHGPMPPGRVIHLLRQVCGALAEAHAAGMVHRDIKPANLFLCERGGVQDVIKLLDFGIVQFSGEASDLAAAVLDAPLPLPGDPSDAKLTMAGHILGTPAYLSPEQSRGEPSDARSDIYSIGAVAYYLLSGLPPFVRATVRQMLEAHEKDPPPLLSEVRPQLDADLVAIVMKCLHKDPLRRYQDVKSLDAALAACASAGSWSADQAASWWQSNRTTPPAASENDLEISSIRTADVPSDSR